MSDYDWPESTAAALLAGLHATTDADQKARETRLLSMRERNRRTFKHEAETPMRGHDDDGTCCLRAVLTPLDGEGGTA